MTFNYCREIMYGMRVSVRIINDKIDTLKRIHFGIERYYGNGKVIIENGCRKIMLEISTITPINNIFAYIQQIIYR